MKTAMLHLLLQTRSHTTREFSLAKSVITEISDTAFGLIIFQYQYLLL